jgi:Leucine-rich repeat (LRR) protein
MDTFKFPDFLCFQPFEILKQGRDVLFGYFRHIYNSKRSRDLILIDMRLEKIDVNFHELTALTALELSGNLITELPIGILLLTNLTVLKAPGNNLINIVESGNLAPLSKLVLLNLKDNCISVLNDSFSKLYNLKEINLRQNKLESVVSSIRHCSQLIRLNIAQNNLDQLSKEVFRIPELEMLDASHNRLSALPNSTCFAVSLVELDLSFNRLQILPAEFGNLALLR